MNLDFRSSAPRAGAIAFSDRGRRSRVCADCRFAQRFALQARAVCTLGSEPLRGRVRPAAQPACAAFAVRDRVDLSMAGWTLAPIVTPSPIVRGRAA
jgi:hypothetical protein